MLKLCLPQRPVEWILWSPSNEIGLIVISEEVEFLITILRNVAKPVVHLITYAAPVTKNMLHFNGLYYYVLPRLPAGYTLPDWFSVELGIFAGRLYIDFAERAPLMKYLQLAGKTDTEAAQSDNERVGLFTDNPVNFLLEWLTLCRKGQDIIHTPMGYVCQGRPLHENHPFFVVRSVEAGAVVPPSVEGRIGGHAEEVEDGDTDVENEGDALDQTA
jgi:hypothetical protein